MAKYQYTGQDGVSMGRFGTLKKGDVIDLSPKEETYVLENKHPHLKAVDDKAAKKDDGKPKMNLPPDFDKLPKDQQDKIRKEEEARLAGLSKANAETVNLELKEMTKAELEEVVAKLRADGKEVKVQKGASKPALVNAILEAKGLQPHADEGDE